MKRVFWLMILLFWVGETNAFSWHQDYTSSSSSQIGATCDMSGPDRFPLQDNLTLLVSNNTPDGIIYDWGYNFLPNFNISCVDFDYSQQGQSSGSQPITSGLSIMINSVSDDGLIATNIPGLYLKIYIYFYNEQQTKRNTEHVIDITNQMGCGDIDSSEWGTGMSPGEYELSLGIIPCNSGGGNITEIEAGIFHLYSTTSHGAEFSERLTPMRFSVRGVLIKKGTIPAINSGERLTINTSLAAIDSFNWEWHTLQTGNYLTGNGITIITPSCSLKTENYTIEMGFWSPQISSVPTYSSETPINIALKCDDEVPHVRFRFEDTGASPLANHNISLYSAEGGEKVDGLEIEMLYNGAHVDIDNTTLVDTGEHGTAGAVGADSTAKFTARYVQRSEITKNGNTYAGPVTGKVNMWVTYD